MNNSDHTRLMNYTAVNTYCDSNLAVGWYRFVGRAGTVLSATFIGPACGSVNTGFISSTEFTNLTYGQSIILLYCFNHYNVNSCDFIQNVTVTYCDNYYVFYIVPSPSSDCNFRYCTV